MTTSVVVRTSIFPNHAVEITFKQRLEVSLDCAKCGRTYRTVVFEPAGEPGRCTPTGHAYRGSIGEIQVQRNDNQRSREVQCVIPLVYEYSPVTDSKYPNRKSSPLPGWGRVSFSATCPSCHRTTECSIQNNAVRPWKRICHCGYTLYEETQPYPAFSLASEA